jgi:hypothetical protein
MLRIPSKTSENRKQQGPAPRSGLKITCGRFDQLQLFCEDGRVHMLRMEEDFRHIQEWNGQGFAHLVQSVGVVAMTSCGYLGDEFFQAWKKCKAVSGVRQCHRWIPGHILLQ